MAFATGPATAADLALPAIYSDHMVLQRDKPVPVWGWSTPGDDVTVEFAGQSRRATAAADGRWMTRLEPLAADAAAKALVVRSARGGTITVNDVLVGEVWLGSGQSNMVMQVSRARDYDAEKAAATLPLVRMFREESRGAAAPQERGAGTWSVCSPDTVGGFSATLFFFGRELHRELGVPVGLVNSSVGGTPIEAWIDAETQAKDPGLAEVVAAERKAAAEFDEQKAREQHEKALEKWKQRAAAAKQAGEPVPKKPKDPLERRLSHGLGTLFNGKIAPLVPFAIRGGLWYQGEANAHPGKGPLYRHQLPLLVTDWRNKWGDDFPFAWVQLPNFNRAGDGWPLVREAMLRSLSVPKTGMAITIDVGDPRDIHPQNKQDVGHRLALWAMGDVYGRPVPATSGPLPSGHEIQGTEIVCRFTAADGLRDRDGGDLDGFVIAGADGQWKPARARIDGKNVVVSATGIASPAAVRYGWEPNPKCDLVNAAGLPASPFRTDDWPVENSVSATGDTAAAANHKAAEQILPADWDPVRAADRVLAGLIRVTPTQVKGAHDAEMAIVGRRAYVVAEVNDVRPGEAAGWPEIYSALAVVDLDRLAVERFVPFARGGQQFDNATLPIGSCFVPRIIRKGDAVLRCFFATEHPGKGESQVWFIDYDLAAGRFATAVHKARLTTAAGTFDMQPGPFHADAAAMGFRKPARDHGLYPFDSFKRFDGQTYVALNNFPGGQNALALLDDACETFTVLGHYNEPQSLQLSESAVNRLPDGSWMAICRQDSGNRNYIFTTSRDGRTWAQGKHLPFVANGTNSKPTFERFGGVYHLGWQEATQIDGASRSVFNVDVSRDGEHWERKYRFQTRDSFQYPTFREHDGTIWLCVTQGDADPSRKERIMFGSLEPLTAPMADLKEPDRRRGDPPRPSAPAGTGPAAKENSHR